LPPKEGKTGGAAATKKKTATSKTNKKVDQTSPGNAK